MHVRSGSLSRLRLSLVTVAVLVACLVWPQWSQAQQVAHGSVRGTVSDPLGAVVAGATVKLVDARGTVVGETRTDRSGAYALVVPTSGLYRVLSTAKTFKPAGTTLRYFGGAGAASLDLTLSTPTLTEEVTVTAVGTPTPMAQVGVAVTVLNADDYRNETGAADMLRQVPGVQITQTGQVGGSTALFLRGGNSNATKVLIDGVPANDIGGGVELSSIDTVGLAKVEVLREPNSALYGSDALAGVVSLTTARGTTRLPLLTYSGDGGNFRTYRNQVSASGVVRSLDYYGAFARLDTRNNQQNAAFHHATYVGNFGWAPNATNDLRFTVRHLVDAVGLPNAVALYGIADAAGTKEHDTYYSAAWNNQTTERWHNQIRYGGLRLNYLYTDYAPTGLYDANTDLYLGAPVTITGANGYSVSGQAIFQYGTSYGSTYPSQYSAPTKRDFVYAQTDYRLNTHVVGLGAFKYEDERGTTASSGLTPTSIERGNYSYTLQVAGDVRNRLYYTLGSGLEDNGLFGFAATPRASLAFYARRPSGTSVLGGTKLHFSFGKGIKEPSIYYQSASLYGTLAAQPNGSQLIAQYHVAPIGPEDSRTFDGGVDQELWNGRARIGVTYFHNEFTNGVEFVPQSALLQLGLSAANDPAVQYGAAVNSQAYRAQGAEVEAEYRIDHHWFARGGYTYLDAVVQRSFASGSENPGPNNPATVYNTSSNFSTIPIGVYAPLVGARPFRRAPQSGYFGINFTSAKVYGSLTGTLVGRRDDSDYLSDANFGYSMLLPNRNLLGAYQRLELSGGYQITHLLSAYVDVQNLLSEHYQEAFGYASLPLTFRSGLRVTFGGESWRVR